MSPYTHEQDRYDEHLAREKDRRRQMVKALVRIVVTLFICGLLALALFLLQNLLSVVYQTLSVV